MLARLMVPLIPRMISKNKKLQYRDNTNFSFLLTTMTTTQKGINDILCVFNSKCIRSMMKILEGLRPNEDLCLVIYKYAFDAKMGFYLGDNVS